MIVPGRDVWEKLLQSQGGLWAIRLDDGTEVFVARLNRALIKFVLGGCRTEALVATIRSSIGPIRVLGFRVFDDPDHPVAVFGVVGSPTELATLDSLLRCGSVRMEFFDEFCVPSLAGAASFDPPPIEVVAVAPPAVDPMLNRSVCDYAPARSATAPRASASPSTSCRIPRGSPA